MCKAIINMSKPLKLEVETGALSAKLFHYYCNFIGDDVAKAESKIILVATVIFLAAKAKG